MAGFYQTESGYIVEHNNIIVAEGLTLSQAGSVADDYTYYGKVVNCIYDRSKACELNFNCDICEVKI